MTFPLYLRCSRARLGNPNLLFLLKNLLNPAGRPPPTQRQARPSYPQTRTALQTRASRERIDAANEAAVLAAQRLGISLHVCEDGFGVPSEQLTDEEAAANKRYATDWEHVRTTGADELDRGVYGGTPATHGGLVDHYNVQLDN